MAGSAVHSFHSISLHNLVHDTCRMQGGALPIGWWVRDLCHSQFGLFCPNWLLCSRSCDETKTPTNDENWKTRDLETSWFLISIATPESSYSHSQLISCCIQHPKTEVNVVSAHRYDLPTVRETSSNCHVSLCHVVKPFNLSTVAH